MPGKLIIHQDWARLGLWGSVQGAPAAEDSPGSSMEGSERSFYRALYDATLS